MSVSTTREKYPDETLPGWLIELRDAGSRETALAAMDGAEARTREIARERIAVLDRHAEEDARAEAEGEYDGRTFRTSEPVVRFPVTLTSGEVVHVWARTSKHAQEYVDRYVEPPALVIERVADPLGGGRAQLVQTVFVAGEQVPELSHPMGSPGSAATVRRYAETIKYDASGHRI